MTPLTLADRQLILCGACPRFPHFWLGAIYAVWYDRAAGTIWRLRGSDGSVLKTLRVNGIGSHFALGQDDHVYVVTASKHIKRYDRDFNPVPFAGTEDGSSEPIPGHRYGLHIMGRGLAAARDGTLYVLHENLPEVHTRYGISVWDPDGRLRKENLVAYGFRLPSALDRSVSPGRTAIVEPERKSAVSVLPSSSLDSDGRTSDPSCCC